MTSFPPPKLQYKLAVIDIQEHRLARIALWRACFLVSCILGLGWLATFPIWQIKAQSQVEIEGEKLVNRETIYQALDFSYPQLVWTVDGAVLTQKLKALPTIQAAKINKQIIPPKIIISVQETTPVALATWQGKVGFLDIHGTWVAQDFYTNIDNDLTLPKLIVLNYQPRSQKSWNTLYQLISLYPELKINEVQWNHSGNLFLKTKIGRVSLGTNLSRLEEQFKILLKLQNLPQKIDPQKIAYIDLSNPQMNLIQRY